MLEGPLVPLEEPTPPCLEEEANEKPSEKLCMRLDQKALASLTATGEASQWLNARC